MQLLGKSKMQAQGKYQLKLVVSGKIRRGFLALGMSKGKVVEFYQSDEGIITRRRR